MELLLSFWPLLITNCVIKLFLSAEPSYTALASALVRQGALPGCHYCQDFPLLFVSFSELTFCFVFFLGIASCTSH